jgi:hypothetical protein
MEIEYSQETRRAYAYRFYGYEMKHIAEGLKPIIKKLEKKIDRIDNHPKNEGQVTFSEQIRELRAEIKSLNEIIEEFSN